MTFKLNLAPSELAGDQEGDEPAEKTPGKIAEEVLTSWRVDAQCGLLPFAWLHW